MTVTVEDGAIAQIEILEHKNERGTPAEKIIDDIIQQQSIDVDAISGFTNSSRLLSFVHSMGISPALILRMTNQCVRYMA